MTVKLLHWKVHNVRFGSAPADESGFDNMFGINVRGPFFLIQALSPVLEAPSRSRRHRRDLRSWHSPSPFVLAARNEEELKKTAACVNSAGAESLICALDLRDPESAETLVKKALERFGRIDALLNIAGAVPQVDLFEMTDAQWEDGAALKFHGARRLTIRAWDALKASNGSVVLISGSAALDPKPEFAAVAAINASITALAKAFAEQGIRDGVQVNSVSCLAP